MGTLLHVVLTDRPRTPIGVFIEPLSILDLEELREMVGVIDQHVFVVEGMHRSSSGRVAETGTHREGRFVMFEQRGGIQAGEESAADIIRDVGQVDSVERGRQTWVRFWVCLRCGQRSQAVSSLLQNACNIAQERSHHKLSANIPDGRDSRSEELLREIEDAAVNCRTWSTST